MTILERKYPLVIRCAHWLNAVLLMIMIWSGLLIYWANPVYRVGWGRATLFPLFPEPFFVALGIPYRLAEGMSLHFFFMWFFALNGLVYAVCAGLSGEARELLPTGRSVSEAVRVLLYDLRLSKIAPPPRKFNGAQQLAYTTVILMGAGSLLTGMANYKPIQFGWLTHLLGGYEWVRWEHFWLAIGYVLFLVVHVVQVVRSGWNHFRAMVTGYELVAPDK